MQWDKLERSFAACEAVLRRLRAVDSFNLMLFNSESNAVRTAAAAPATPENIESRRWHSSAISRIRGGTGLQRALDRGAPADLRQTRRISC